MSSVGRGLRGRAPESIRNEKHRVGFKSEVKTGGYAGGCITAHLSDCLSHYLRCVLRVLCEFVGWEGAVPSPDCDFVCVVQSPCGKIVCGHA